MTGQQVCAGGAQPATASGQLPSFRTANFLVTAERAATAQVVAESAERYRTKLWRQWFAHDPPGDWSQPARVNFVLRAGNGGSTSFMCDGGQCGGFEGRWQGNAEANRTVTPHEVMHMILASEMGQYTVRWLDEGIATNIEAPAEANHWWGMAHDLAAQRQLLSVRELCANREFNLRTYAQGTTLVAMLLERPPGRAGVVALARQGRSGDWDAAFRTVYRMTPEEVHTVYCGWLARQPRGGPLERVIAGVAHVFDGSFWQPATAAPAAPAVRAGPLVQSSPPAPAPAPAPAPQPTLPVTLTPIPSPPAAASSPAAVATSAPSISQGAPPAVAPIREILPPPAPRAAGSLDELAQGAAARWAARALVALGVAAPLAVPIATVAVPAAWWLGRRRLQKRIAAIEDRLRRAGGADRAERGAQSAEGGAQSAERGDLYIGHGIGDLTAEEQAAYARRPRLVIEVPRREVEQQFVRVPAADYDAEGFRQAIAAELKINGHYGPVLNRIIEGAKLVADGLRTQARMTGAGERASDIVVKRD